MPELPAPPPVTLTGATCTSIARGARSNANATPAITSTATPRSHAFQRLPDVARGASRLMRRADISGGIVVMGPAGWLAGRVDVVEAQHDLPRRSPRSSPWAGVA